MVNGCPICGGPLKPLFTGMYCPRDCDRPRATAEYPSLSKNLRRDFEGTWSLPTTAPTPQTVPAGYALFVPVVGVLTAAHRGDLFYDFRTQQGAVRFYPMTSRTGLGWDANVRPILTWSEIQDRVGVWGASSRVSLVGKQLTLYVR